MCNTKCEETKCRTCKHLCLIVHYEFGEMEKYDACRLDNHHVDCDKDACDKYEQKGTDK